MLLCCTLWIKKNVSVKIYFLIETPAKPSSHSSAEGKRGYTKLMRDVTQSRCGLCGVADRFGARGLALVKTLACRMWGRK